MENSKSSIIRLLSFNAVGRSSTSEEEEPFEESGWTSYMEDFMFDRTRDENGVFYSSVNSESCYCSLTDAADSSVCRKSCSLTCNNGGVVEFCMEIDQCHRSNGLSRKKRKKTAEALEDDDLEDTATSAHPVAIPKVSYFNQMDLRHSPEQKKHKEITQVKDKGKGFEYGHVEDRIEVGFLGRDINCSTGLKNIGLCLVPVSMAVNYFG